MAAGAARIVPASFVRPVPAAEARSPIQELLDAQRERVEAMAEGDRQALTRQLLATEAELRRRLERLRGERGDQAWTTRDTEATLVQVRAQLGRMGPKFAGMLQANADTARRLGCRTTVDVLAYFERAQKGALRPLALEASQALSDSLLERHEASVARYGAQTIERVKAVLARGALVGDTFDEMVGRLTGRRGEHGVVVESAGWAGVIVRTELAHAYNAGAHAESLAQRATFPDLQKRLIETFDSRTGDDSRAAHGEVRDLEAMFEDGAGRRYLHPPGRPNDRGVEIPWRKAWEEGAPQGGAKTQAAEEPEQLMAVRPPGTEPVPPQNRAAVKLAPEPIQPGAGPTGAPQPPTVGTHLTGSIRTALDNGNPNGPRTTEVLRVLDEAGLLPFLARHPLGSVEVGATTWTRTNPLNPSQILGGFNGRYVGGNIQANAGKRVSATPGMATIGQGWEPQPPGTKPHLRPDNFSCTGASGVEAGRRTLVHEVGHHVIRVGNGGTLLAGPALDLIEKAYQAGRNALTQYGDDSAAEYFCECFALYSYARADLKRCDPVGFKLVEDVLRLPSVGLLP